MNYISADYKKLKLVIMVERMMREGSLISFVSI